MFWDRVAGVYDLFINVYNDKVHKQLRETVNALIKADDEVLENCTTSLIRIQAE